ncbi:MAG: Hemerythrin cation binding protein [Acidimicrobiaceae bacterium]|nr:Hemerythrin cation binding protein [Acidimicrobiaceae bacterium]
MVPSRERAIALLSAGLARGSDSGGERPGLVYLVATGVATDNTDGLTSEELQRAGLLPSAQHLSNPPTHRPDHGAKARPFLRARASRDSQMQAAARSEHHGGGA